MSLRDEIIPRWETILEKIEKSCVKVGRHSREIEVVAVTKTYGLDVIEAAIGLGLRSFGENYVQEALEKVDYFKRHSAELRWHFIGHLQSNKAKFVVPRFELIHSVDRLSLAMELEKQAQRLDRNIHVLLEVNIADEHSKQGVVPASLLDLVKNIHERCPHLLIEGLMSFPPYQSDPEHNRNYFRQTRQLSESIEKLCVDGVNMRQLSMGVSNDFEVAIEEGSTLVRIGSSLFGERNQKP